MQKKSPYLESYGNQKGEYCERGFASGCQIRKTKIPNRLAGNNNVQHLYERAQQNSRIIKRIKNPQRDKTIIKSLQQIGKRPKQEVRAKTRQELRRNSHFFQKQSDKNSLANLSQEYSLKLENKRMGMRIINARSIVRNLISSHSIKRKNLSPESKINKGVEAFFSSDCESTSQLGEGLVALKRKPYYGHGPTILRLESITISHNPPLNEYDLVYLQLLVQNANPRLYRTNLVPYLLLRQTTFKFALRLREIGQFVPLKIWKVNGLENISLGIVDIHFLHYLQKQQIIKHNDSLPSPEPTSHQFIQRNSSGQFRVLIQDKISSKFRKQKLDEVQGTICFHYAIYRKKYS